jgi:hypothetical protein
MTITADRFNQGPSVLEQLRAETRLKTAALPPDKTVATVVAVDYVGGVLPWRARWGTAVRMGDHFELSLETQTKFTKASTSAGLYVMWSK